MSTPDESALRDLAAAYALGALSPEETRAFEAHLAKSAEARREVAELRETAALLAFSAPEARPAPALRARVLEAVSAGKVRPLPSPPPATAPAPAARRLAPLLWGALAASLLAAAVGLGVRSARLADQLARRTAELAGRDTTIARQAQTLAEQGRELASRDSTLASLLSPGVELVQLTASGNPEPRIQLFWDRRHGTAILHASRLKPVPPGRTYQLWFIEDGKPVPSVTFNVAPAGEAVVSRVAVPSEGQASAAAVTEEPAGGSPQPTTPVLLVGALPKT